MPSVMRVLDANANRAREALRVLEEAARFILGDETIVREVKSIRHELREVLNADPQAANPAIHWRDTPGDVGTRVTTEAETQRDSPADVAIAAGKRLSEALRVLEEYTKVLPSPAASGRLEALRYRGYEVERLLHARLGSGRRRQWRLCVLLSESLCPKPRDWFAVAEAAVAGGADCIQLREKTLEGGELLARARRLVELCRPQGVAVIINDRPDVALLAAADGVHVGQGDLPVPEVRKLVGRQLLVGVSTSRLAEAERALADGADYCGIGPMFPTTTKRKDAIAGPDYLKAFVAWGRLPHLAIGGIGPGNVAELVGAGAAGVAVSSCVCGAGDPAATCRELASRLTGGWQNGASPDAAATPGAVT